MPLLTRFQGCLVGALLGELISGNAVPSPWWQVAMLGASCAIDTATFASADWEARCDRASHLTRIGTAASSEAAIAVLPVALYYHELPERLRREILLAAFLWLGAKETPAAALTFATAIATALQQRSPAENFDRLVGPADSNELTVPLEIARASRANGVGLAEYAEQIVEARVPMGDRALAIALYARALPGQPSLQVARAVKVAGGANVSPSVVGALVGAIAGAESGNSFPLRWQVALQERVAIASVYRQAARLFASWAGVGSPNGSAELELDAIAAAGRIQARASLISISH
ncbi:ADP-ribosylglycohydrolase family protein [Rubidibacter lacunae]|uniref:ADP-ribosylglycohydrolase family protein n=1 Tax=Rubidibacter lacunae TaxID=582514 RepID=UPI00041BEEA8|nr:ADP-ribosylglycohydrolase family protein [Rubidibacter lacunae]